MRIAIVHYHLSPGGVTTVIRAASNGLTREEISHVILCGSSSSDDLPARIIPDLHYLPATARTAASLLDEMRRAAGEALGGPPDVWHFHNHSLGKNILMPAVVSLLAEAGECLLLQIHDLAEEGRPGNYPLIKGQQTLYPVGARVRYAFLNGRDRSRFITAGLPEENAVLLPNPIPDEATAALPSPGEKPLILYPTRAIRRKNLGELLLLSLYAPKDTRFAITRAPEDPSAKQIHDHWEQTARDLELPVYFNVVDRIPPEDGLPPSYESWIQAASHFISTSVAEGFGMIFPEASALGKPLIGRELPTHPQPGSPSLYRSIRIPAEWIPPSELRRHLSRHLGETYRLYQRPLPPVALDLTSTAIHHDDHLDFGNLPETLQRQILILLRDDDSLNPVIGNQAARAWMSNALERSPVPYAGQGIPVDDYGRILVDCYLALEESPPGSVDHIQPERILDACLSPESFHFLLTIPQKIRAVIFDIYGTLLIAPPGAVKPDPEFDPEFREILAAFGHDCGSSPSHVLHEAVVRNHAASVSLYPEVDLRQLWQEILHSDEEMDTLVTTVEKAWHPCRGMPHARETLMQLSEDGVLLGILSNAQANTQPALDEALGRVTSMLAPELTVLSYQHGIAKPSPELFHLLVEKLAALGISPRETLFVGNDPGQDILPAEAAGFRTALFAGHPDSWRPGECSPDLFLRCLSEITAATSSF